MAIMVPTSAVAISIIMQGPMVPGPREAYGAIARPGTKAPPPEIAADRPGASPCAACMPAPGWSPMGGGGHADAFWMDGTNEKNRLSVGSVSSLFIAVHHLVCLLLSSAGNAAVDCIGDHTPKGKLDARRHCGQRRVDGRQQLITCGRCLGWRWWRRNVDGMMAARWHPRGCARQQASNQSDKGTDHADRDHRHQHRGRQSLIGVVARRDVRVGGGGSGADVG
ncbi:hypothetical protein U1Q18_051635 [Sarracenia purpurea var. burkii]